MRSNSRLMFVGMLVFVFPLLFIWVNQHFFTTAYDNIETAEKRRVGLMHDTLSVVIATSTDGVQLVQSLMREYAADNQDISKFRIVVADNNRFRIIEALDESLIGSYEESDQLYRTLPLSGSEDSFIYQSMIDGVRTWQVFRAVERDGVEYLIFSEHRFDFIDSVMSARQQRSYLALTVIFAFLIALAYWLNRQVHWEQHHKQLTHQLKERDLFSNMIAHEFRSPLTAIKGYASFLEESANVDKDERRYAANIRSSAERLVLLVNDFLEVARLQSGRLQVQKSSVDVNELLQRVAVDLKGLAEEKGLVLSFNQLQTPLHFVTDPDRMMQVLVNIVTNAIKYTDSGSVALEASKIPGRLTITVKDTGMGISADDQKKLFSPFTRVGGVDQTATVGTGLGMWITKQLVDLLDGEIGVESIKGVGTHVVITFKG